MSFYEIYKEYKEFDFESFFASASVGKCEKILSKEKISVLDFLTLLSVDDDKILEKMAQKANMLTKQHFGKAIVLYTPIYISNFCNNHCVYCGFNTKNQIKRKQLSFDEIRDEALQIAKTGMMHILLLTGDAAQIATFDYIKESIKILREVFSSVSIEIYALNQRKYKALIDEGVDNLTIYQETYNEDLYKKLHLKGAKKNYLFRLDAPQRACESNIRSINIGALLGLDDWRYDAFFTALHAEYLQNKYIDTEVSVSMPRIRPCAGDGFSPNFNVSDKTFVRILTAFRLFMPRIGISLSTRESTQFRNNVLKLGITKMSAGSSTGVGERSTKDEAGDEQFEISDRRSAVEVEEDLAKMGFQAVYKDWQTII